jgi:hypothetical protein
VPKGKHRVYNSKGEEDLLFPSKGFSSGSFEKADGGTSGSGERKSLFID